MILISMEFLLVSLFTAQLEVRAWTPEMCFRNGPYNLCVIFKLFLYKKFPTENLYGKKDAPYSSEL